MITSPLLATKALSPKIGIEFLLDFVLFARQFLYWSSPIFPLQLKCKLCWSELTLESQHTPVTRAVFHQISTDWQHTKYRIPKYIKYCKQQKKKEIKHQTYWWIIDKSQSVTIWSWLAHTCPKDTWDQFYWRNRKGIKNMGTRLTLILEQLCWSLLIWMCMFPAGSPSSIGASLRPFVLNMSLIYIHMIQLFLLHNNHKIRTASFWCKTK